MLIKGKYIHKKRKKKSDVVAHFAKLYTDVICGGGGDGYTVATTATRFRFVLILARLRSYLSIFFYNTAQYV